jgi:hypothetical protein
MFRQISGFTAAGVMVLTCGGANVRGLTVLAATGATQAGTPPSCSDLSSEPNSSISAKHAALDGVLGHPVSPHPVRTVDGIGCVQRFERGSIYWTSDTGAHAVFDDMRDRWAAGNGCLGYPTSDRYVSRGKTRQDFQGGTITLGKPYACGSLDWAQPPAGIVFGLKHSSDQPTKALMWDGESFDPARADVTPPTIFRRQHGGDAGAPAGVFSWFESSGADFEFPDDIRTWRSFLSHLPGGLVLGLKHSRHQADKALTWLPPEPVDGSAQLFDSATDDEAAVRPASLEIRYGADAGGRRGEGFYWYEVSQRGHEAGCTTALPGGLVFGLKHATDRARTFTWRGHDYDAADVGGPLPPGFARCHAADARSTTSDAFYWFETLGTAGPTEQDRLAGCETSPSLGVKTAHVSEFGNEIVCYGYSRD